MTGEALAWKNLATSVLNGFGDVVRSGSLLVPYGAGVYDPVLGVPTATYTSTTVRYIFTQDRSKLANRDLWMEGDYVALVEGVNLTGAPVAGSRFVIDRTFEVIQAESEGAGVGAIYYLHLRRIGV